MSDVLTLQKPTTQLAAAQVAARPTVQRRRAGVVRRLWKHKPAAIGGAFLCAMILLACFGPYLAPVDPLKINPRATLATPSLAHLMGTDQYGRDVFSRVISGARLSLQIGFVAVAVGAAFGVVLGLLAGFNGGKIDQLIMRGTDVLMAFPSILLALVVVAIMGVGVGNVMVAVGISLIAIYVRLVRSVTIVIREQLYVEAARVVGAPAHRLITRHIFPNAVPPILILSSVAVAWAILTGASLSFLGLGPPQPTPEWGLDLSNGRHDLRVAWWISTFPGLAIALTVVGVNLLGDGLREALDPKLRHAGDG